VNRVRRARSRAPIARSIVAAAVVGGLLWLVGPSLVLETLSHADGALLAAAFASVVAYSAVRAWAWRQLLVALGIERARSFHDVLGCYGTGALLGTVLPSTAGTDAVRAVLAQRRFGGTLAAHLAAIVVLNAVSWLAACVLGLVALAVLQDALIALVAAPLFFGVIAGLAATHWLLRDRRAWWLWLLRKVPTPLRRVRRQVRRFAGSLMVFERVHARFGPVLAAALLAQLGVASMWALTAAAVGIELDHAFWVVYAPLVSAVALLPVSVSGFGADQAAFVYVLGLLAVPASLAFAASALGATVKTLFNLTVGGLAFVAWPFDVKNLSHNQ